MAPIVINSIRGKDLLLLDKYTYAKDKILKSGEVYWRCTHRRLKCTAKVFTVGSELTISRSDLVHNHEENIQKLHRQVIGNACKRKAEDDISEKPSKIIRVLSTHFPEEITTTDINYIRRNMYNCRRNILPGVLPKNLHEVHQIVDTYSPKTSGDENFLLSQETEDTYQNESNIIKQEIDDIQIKDEPIDIYDEFAASDIKTEPTDSIYEQHNLIGSIKTEPSNSEVQSENVLQPLTILLPTIKSENYVDENEDPLSKL